MPDFLAQMAEFSRQRAAEARREVPEPTLRDQIATLPPPQPLPRNHFLLIAELKRASPAQGRLADDALDIQAQANAYTCGGASAISILTEPSRFNGSLDDLRRISTGPLPAMRKDFLVEPYQLLEARAHGASGILLIVKILDDAQLRDMLATAAALDLFTLLESFDEEDLQRCQALLAAHQSSATPEVLLGLNTRDLRDLSVRSQRLAQLAPHFPPGYRRIAESGLSTPADISAAARLGYHGALIGTALMQSPDPAALCRDLLAAGTQAITARSCR